MSSDESNNQSNQSNQSDQPDQSNNNEDYIPISLLDMVLLNSLVRGGSQPLHHYNPPLVFGNSMEIQPSSINPQPNQLINLSSPPSTVDMTGMLNQTAHAPGPQTVSDVLHSSPQPTNINPFLIDPSTINDDETIGLEDDIEDEGGDDEDDENEGTNALQSNPLLQQLIGSMGGMGGMSGMSPMSGVMMIGPNGQQMMLPNPVQMGLSGGLMALLGGESLNYYENANAEFKELIGDNEDAQKLFNCCCKILMGPYRDFVGRFTDKLLCKAHTVITEYYHVIISRLYDEEADFLDNIFVPVLNELYMDYRKRRDELAKKKLEDCIHEFKEGDKFENDCCICLCEIDDKYAKLPCGHIMHYECVRKWFAEKLVCPTCRYSFEEDENDDEDDDNTSNADADTSTVNN